MFGGSAGYLIGPTYQVKVRPGSDKAWIVSRISLPPYLHTKLDANEIGLIIKALLLP